MKVIAFLVAFISLSSSAFAEKVVCDSSTHRMTLKWSNYGYVMHLVDKKTTHNNGVIAANYIIGGFEGAMGSLQSDSGTFSVFSAAEFIITMQDTTPSTGRPLDEEMRLKFIALHTLSNTDKSKDLTSFNPKQDCTLSEIENSPNGDGIFVDYKNSFNKEDL